MKKISVIVTTYNHEKYIAQCLDGILAQKNCPEFEIVIGNDFSTDKTEEVILEYKKKFPEIIKILPRTQNLGMQKNLKDCFAHCSGDYIAICEGDDFWIDEFKLKKQYEALEQDAMAIMSFTDLKFFTEENGIFVYKDYIPETKKDSKVKLNIRDMIKYNNPIGNFSVCMYKKEAIKLVPDSFYENPDNFDWLFNLYVLDNSFYAINIDDYSSAYRKNGNGLWSGLSDKKKYYKMMKAIFYYNYLFDYKYFDEFLILNVNINTTTTKLKNPAKAYKKLIGWEIPILDKFVGIGLFVRRRMAKK